MTKSVWLFSFTAFLSATLIFLMEPMMAKRVLPTFGGAPMVWNACTFFFQMVLLAGYAYAWSFARWLTPRVQAGVHVAVLAFGLLALPVAFAAPPPPPAGWSQVVWLLLRLAATIALPFFALSANAPILQHWLAQTGDRSSRDPYFLYAASNLGSFGALMAYPFAIEPALGVGAQVRGWWAAYAALLVLAAVCATLVWRRSPASPPVRRGTDAGEVPARGRVGWRARGWWLVLAFVPSSLMLSVTSHISTDVAAIPLLWVVPLAIYLLTFVIAFGTAARWWREVANRALPLLLVPVVLLMTSRTGGPLLLSVPLHLGVFLSAALVCHGRLADSRPSVAHLTEFYVWIALGGLLGGAFNTLAAPALFTGIAEYPLGLVLACMLRPRFGDPPRGQTLVPLDLVVAGVVFVLVAAAIVGVGRAGGDAPALLVALTIPGVISFSRSRRPLGFSLSLAAMLLSGASFGRPYGRVLYAERTFFGVHRVSVDASRRYVQLFHGSTLHGEQATEPSRRSEALTYYHRTGPFGQALARVPVMARSTSVAVVGLGIGSLAAYAGPERQMTFYEIDPVVERIARQSGYFTHLRDCGNRCRVVIGDARLSLAEAPPHAYDVIVLDAFSSDAIPVHLLTSEAVDLYLSRLASPGVLAFHVSNRHLVLGPVLARLAAARGLAVIEGRDNVTRQEVAQGRRRSDWVLMARDAGDLSSLTDEPVWFRPEASPSTPLWTDDFSNLLSVLGLP